MIQKIERRTVKDKTTEHILLIAGDGKILVSPTGSQYSCIAVDSLDGWTEIDYVEQTEEHSEDWKNGYNQAMLDMMK